MDKEIWKPIPDFPNYEVSNLGRVRSLDTFVSSKNNSKALRKGKILKPRIDNGYSKIGLSIGSNKKRKSIHRLVAEAFIPNPEKKPQVNHIDGNKQNNCAENLEWCTAKENINHAIKSKLRPDNNGQYNKQAKFTNKQAKEIRKEYISHSKTNNMNALSKKYGVTRKIIFNIIHNKSYKE